MDLLQLRYFYDSANYLSISKAAQKYGVPPTSISASIRRLEAELGCKLFERSPNRISLNEKGAIMKASLKVIFGELDGMLERISGATDDAKEVKLLVKAMRSRITDKVILFKNKYTHARFKLVADFEEAPTDDYDIIIDTESDRYIGFEKMDLGNQPIFLYVTANHELIGQKLRLERLSEMPFVLMSQQGNYGKLFTQACKGAGFSPNIVAQVNDSACFRKIISSGIAIGVSGELAASSDSNSAFLPLNVSDFKPQQKINLYYKKENNYGNTAKFISFLKEHS